MTCPVVVAVQVMQYVYRLHEVSTHPRHTTLVVHELEVTLPWPAHKGRIRSLHQLATVECGGVETVVWTSCIQQSQLA